ncbi:MAG: sugar phosphate isomerase [Saprospiraceae bacterium]|nr:MAG: sugar phosphate isomerase [Saprospiraceae bacterium]
MMVPGVASVTFRDRTPQEVIKLAVKAGLEEIEWGGDIHVPAGHFEQATTIGRLTKEARLMVSAYGSYYVVGKSSDEGKRFADVLNTAEALNAPIIRIWAGEKSSAESTRTYRRKVLDETRVLADKAGRKGICLAFEFHDNTLNDTYTACCELLTELAHPQIKTYWQPLHGAGPDINGAGIKMILPWIVGVHVFHWWPKAEVRLPLQDGANDWKQYINHLSKISETISCNLEFVKDNSAEQFLKDAKTLQELLGIQ